MLYTCGLSNIGIPCTDGNEEYIMEIYGEMREAAHFKENLVLKNLTNLKNQATASINNDLHINSCNIRCLEFTDCMSHIFTTFYSSVFKPLNGGIVHSSGKVI